MKHWKMAVMKNAGRNLVSANRGMTRLFYDAMGRFYDALYHRCIRGYVESAESLMKDLVEEGDWVLDVGCGTGLLSYLAFPKAGRVVGVDLSMGMLQKGLRKRTPEKPVNFVNGDALNLPFNCRFDCCVSAFMLVMLPRPERWRVISQMTHLLKPGGRIAFLSSRHEIGHQWFSHDEWKQGLERLGFEGVQVVNEGDVFLTVVGSKPEKDSHQSSPSGITSSAYAEIGCLSQNLPAWMI